MRLSIVTASILTFIGVAKAYENLPYPCVKTYQVTTGESRQSVASKFGISAAQIDEWNPCQFNDVFAVSTNCNLQSGELLCVDHVYSKAKRAAKSKRSKKVKRGGGSNRPGKTGKTGKTVKITKAKSNRPANSSKTPLKQSFEKKPFKGGKSSHVLPIHQKRAAIPPSIVKLAIEKAKDGICSWFTC